MKKLTGISFLFFLVLSLFAQDDEYTKVITGRAENIVNAMTFSNEEVKDQVKNIIIEHYRFLNDVDEACDADIVEIREAFVENKELRDSKVDLRKAEKELAVRDHHFAFLAQLKQLISEEQIDQVKDGLTYGVLELTYNSFCEMIPSMTEEEKNQLRIWLYEAREHAIDGGSSKEKHAWFGKYKGRMNNYLSKRGYDLQEERRNWEERIKANKE